MPMYTYRCDECGHEFEVRQRFADAPLEECPVCHSQIRRVINSVGVVFKGSGFYVTDNRNGKSKSSTAATPSTDTPAEKSDTGEKTAVADTASTQTENKDSKDSKKSKPASKE